MEHYGPSTYGDRIAEVYDCWYEVRLDPSATVDLLADLAVDGQPLELGIGTGRVAPKSAPTLRPGTASGVPGLLRPTAELVHTTSQAQQMLCDKVPDSRGGSSPSQRRLTTTPTARPTGDCHHGAMPIGLGRRPPFRFGVAPVVLAAMLLLVCGDDEDETIRAPEAPMTIRLTSPAFAEGEAIPRPYTCDGQDRSPPLAWSDLPEGTVELALLVEDPDAPRGTFIHWVAWGLDPAVSGMAEGQLPAGVKQGRNGFGKRGYGGPCPPKGDQPHRYVFTIFGLSDRLSLDAGASAEDLRRAMVGKVLGEGRVVGRYGR